MEKYIDMIAEITKEEKSQIQLRMDEVQRAYGITYKEYFDNELYLMPEGRLALRAARLQRGKQNRQAAFDHITAVTGMSKKEAVARIKAINAKGIKKINVFFYEKFEMFLKDDEEVETLLHTLNQRDALRDELLADFSLIDKGEKDYEDIEDKEAAFHGILETLLTDTFREKLRPFFADKRKNMSLSDGELDRIFADMEATRLLLGFSFGEYTSFRFDEKSLQQKRSYISNKERMEVLRLLNESDSCELLTNKVSCYQLLKEFYHRKQVYVQSMEDYPAFEAFCKGLDVFVKKSVALSMGKGVEPIALTEETNRKELMERILDESGSFIAEELIQTHRKIKKISPASVNTVRLETYYDGEKTIVNDAFMRFGQGGTFVDNAGAGGIFAAVDPKKGVITSDGFDESGNLYETHPDTGYRFKGYRLPAWRKALKLCEEISNKVPGVQFIGWDLVYTKERKWVIVEGNAKPQIICNQTSQGKGLRKQFLDCVGIDGSSLQKEPETHSLM